MLPDSPRNWPEPRTLLKRLYYWLRSFFVSSRTVRDYPIRIRRNVCPGEEPTPSTPYLAQVIGWWVQSGMGKTPEEALQELGKQLEEFGKRNRMPRPGCNVPIRFAPRSRISRHSDITDDFARYVLNTELYLFTDQTALAHFGDPMEVAEKIRERYGVTLLDPERALLVDVIETIAAHRSH